MKVKWITLLSGNEDGQSWRIPCQITDKGTFKNKGAHFDFCFSEERNKYNKMYYKNNAEKLKKQTKDYKQTEAGKKVTDKYEKSLKRKRSNKAWQKSLKGRICQKGYNFKRRKLGFIPINSPFERSEGHHLDTHFVMYIPKELHHSIPHNIWNGNGMKEINAIAINFFQQQTTSEKSIIEKIGW